MAETVEAALIYGLLLAARSSSLQPHRRETGFVAGTSTTVSAHRGGVTVRDGRAAPGLVVAGQQRTEQTREHSKKTGTWRSRD